MRYELSITDKQLICKLYDEHFKKDDEQVGKLIVDYKEYKLEGYVDLIISAWYVDVGYQHVGYGKEMLKKVFNSINKYTVNRIKYIWNGVNEYVGYWLEKFDATNDCPISFLKNSEKDSWECHLYTLNKDKFLKYLEV